MKEEKYEKFPELLSLIKFVIMKMVFSKKHAMYIAMVEALQDMASSTLPQQNGLSFCLTKYKGPTPHDVQACICIEGFSIIQAIVKSFKMEGSPTGRKTHDFSNHII